MGVKHVHSYIRQRLGKNRSYIVYRCLYCSHYITRKFALGRECLCDCGTIFHMTAKDITLAKPLCLACRVKRRKDFVDLKTLLLPEIDFNPDEVIEQIDEPDEFNESSIDDFELLYEQMKEELGE